MNLNKFTLKAQEAIQSALQLAEQFGHQEIAPAHVLAVLNKTAGRDYSFNIK